MHHLNRLAGAALLFATAGVLFAEDWTRFRGPNGSGITSESGLPTSWSESKNLAWKYDLPGAGSSSPVTTGPYVFVTCYSGYGLDRSNPGDMAKLERHLLCLDRKSGEKVWQKTIAAKQPEDEFSGFICDHGYATSTPATDGERVYAFFGKSGVYAFDLKGKQLWQRDVGSDSGFNNWGSGSSPVLVGDILIVNADAESEAVYGLDKLTGEVKWKASASGYKGTWSTPVAMQVGEKTEVVLVVGGEVWGLDPKTGGLLWYCEIDSRGACTSAVVKDGVAYVITGGPGGSVAIAIRGGGRKDVAKTHVVWQKRVGSYVPSPVVVGENLVWVESGKLHVLAAKSGEEVLTQRLNDADGIYASLVAAADGKLYAVTRRKGTIVLEGGDKPKSVERNVFATDDTDFNASPAVRDGKLFLRSNRRLYCIGG